MTPVQMLAAATRPLADILVDRLRRSLTPQRVPNQLHGVGGPSQLALRFEDECEVADIGGLPNVLRPDDVAAAVLLGHALDRRRDVLARLQDADAVALIEVPTSQFVDPIKRLFCDSVLGADVPVLFRHDLSCGLGPIAAPHTVAVFTARDEDKGKKSASDESEFAAAVQRRCAVVGIAADPERLLPRDLVRLAEHRIVVPPFDGAAVAAVMAAVTGRDPGAIDDALARRVTLDALAVAVRADIGPERSLARLRRLLDQDAKMAAPAPLLSEMHGLGGAKDWGLALIDDLRAYAAGRLPWTAVDKACLLTGLPGTGKTSFARAISRQADVHFVATSYAQWQAHREGHLGHVTQAIRNAFAEAQQNRPAILFLDEIDTVPARGSGKGNDDWWTAITNTLLECLDGFERRAGVVVIAACNDPARLDPALVRAGRLDRHIEIPLPDVPALAGIFRTHLGDDLAGVDLRPAALASYGRTGADVERFVREARGLARRAGRAITMDDLLASMRAGAPEWTVELRRRIAYHEAGHAVATLALGVAAPVAISIHAGGGMAESEPGEIKAQTRGELESYLIALLAGRAAEELVFGEPTAGAGGSEDSDLGKATHLAIRIETAYGLGSLGMVWVADATNPRDLLLIPELRAAVRRTIDNAHAAALDLLSKHRPLLDALAEALVARGYLDCREMNAILAQVPSHTPMAAGRPVAPAAQPSALLGDGNPGTKSIADDGASDAVAHGRELSEGPTFSTTEQNNSGAISPGSHSRKSSFQ